MVENFELDMLDRKILGSLDRDGRISLSRIAKNVGASRERVHYRFHRLIDESVIKYFEPIIDFGLTGRVLYKISLNLIATPASVKGEVAAWVLSFPRVRRDVLVFGSEDVKVYIWADVHELKEFIVSLQEQFCFALLNVDVNVVSDTWEYGHQYLHGVALENYLPPSSHRREVFEDVLGALRDDGRRSSVDVARELGLSAQTVARKITSMSRSGILACVRPRINVTRLGYTRYKVVACLEQGAKRSSFCTQLQLSPAVVWAEEVLGSHDFGFVAHFRTSRQLEELLEHLDGVRDFRVHVLR